MTGQGHWPFLLTRSLWAFVWCVRVWVCGCGYVRALMCAGLRAHACLRVFVGVSVCWLKCVCVCVFARACVSECVCLCVRMFVCVGLRVRVFTFLFVCVCARAGVYVCVRLRS